MPFSTKITGSTSENASYAVYTALFLWNSKILFSQPTFCLELNIHSLFLHFFSFFPFSMSSVWEPRPNIMNFIGGWRHITVNRRWSSYSVILCNSNFHSPSLRSHIELSKNIEDRRTRASVALNLRLVPLNSHRRYITTLPEFRDFHLIRQSFL